MNKDESMKDYINNKFINRVKACWEILTADRYWTLAYDKKGDAKMRTNQLVDIKPESPIIFPCRNK